MPSTTKLGHPISVQLPDKLRERVEALAAATGRSQSDVVREALERELKNMEWELDIINLVADLRSGRESTASLEELEARLGLQDAPVDSRVLDEID